MSGTSARRGQSLQHLAKWRHIRHFSQIELAAKTGITHQAIGKLEQGINYARPSTTIKIAAALELPAAILLRDPDDLSLDEMKDHNPMEYQRIMVLLQRQKRAKRSPDLPQSA